MKRLTSMGLRLLGVALVFFVLYQVQYRDKYRYADGSSESGAVVEEGGRARFEVAGSDRRIPLPEDWRTGASLPEGESVRPGLFSIVLTSQKLLLAICCLIYGPITLISITRWWYLLRKVGIPIRFREAFRLTFVGFFFNSAVPGLTGGDVVKAFYIARHAVGARVRAVMSVLVDRVIGLFALGLLSGIVLLPHLDDPRFRTAAIIVGVFLGVATVFGAVFLSRRLRNLVRLEALIRKLPLSHVFTEVDQGIVIYRSYPGAVGIAIALSLLNHVALVFMAVGMGHAIGIAIPAAEYFILVPVCMMMASIPLLPGGWGVREGAFAMFFVPMGVPLTEAVALSILIGLTQLAWSLLGGVFFLSRPDDRVSSSELVTFSREVGEEVEAATVPET